MGISASDFQLSVKTSDNQPSLDGQDIAVKQLREFLESWGASPEMIDEKVKEFVDGRLERAGVKRLDRQAEINIGRALRL